MLFTREEHQTKKGKKKAHDIIHSCQLSSRPDQCSHCQTQFGCAEGHAFATFKAQFLTVQTLNQLENCFKLPSIFFFFYTIIYIPFLFIEPVMLLHLGPLVTFLCSYRKWLGAFIIQSLLPSTVADLPNHF